MNWSAIESLLPKTGQAVNFAACLSAFPILEKAKETPQSAPGHMEGDVWTHTQMVVSELMSLPDYLQASDKNKLILLLSALLHDVAKHSATTINEETGQIGHPGHSRKGAIDARILLWQVKNPRLSLRCSRGLQKLFLTRLSYRTS